MNVWHLFSLLAACAVTSGCTFAQIGFLNVPLLVRTPDAVQGKLAEAMPKDSALSVLWIGHATTLIQIDDKFVLTDPVFTEFIGGVSRRLVEPGFDAQNLPQIAVTLVSHRHFDHLSPSTFEMIGGRLRQVLVPDNTASDIPEGSYQTTEIGWWQSFEHDGMRVTAVPVDHKGDRIRFDRDSHPRSFTGYVIEYHGKRVYFGGDTSYRPDLFSEVAARFGTIDLAILPICPIKPEAMMKPNHLTPAEAMRAADELNARNMVPIHYDTFINSFDKPGECGTALRQAMAAGPARRTTVQVLRIGEQRVLVRASQLRSGVASS